MTRLLDGDYDALTARDIAELLDHLAELHCGPDAPDPAEHAAFLTRKAALLTNIAARAIRTRPDAYAAQVHQIATNARAAATHARLELPPPRVGPNPRRTTRVEHNHEGKPTGEVRGQFWLTQPKPRCLCPAVTSRA